MLVASCLNGRVIQVTSMSRFWNNDAIQELPRCQWID